MSKRYVCVFRRKSHGKDFPRTGLPSSVEPGDFLTFFINGAYHVREVADTHHDKKYVITKPLTYPMGGKEHVLDGPRKVPWDDMDSADRPKEGYVQKSTVPDPPLKPEPELPPQEPKVSKRAPKKPSPQPKAAPPPKPEPALPPPAPEPDPASPMDLWSLLDD